MHTGLTKVDIPEDRHLPKTESIASAPTPDRALGTRRFASLKPQTVSGLIEHLEQVRVVRGVQNLWCAGAGNPSDSMGDRHASG